MGTLGTLPGTVLLSYLEELDHTQVSVAPYSGSEVAAVLNGAIRVMRSLGTNLHCRFSGQKEEEKERPNKLMPVKIPP